MVANYADIGKVRKLEAGFLLFKFLKFSYCQNVNTCSFIRKLLEDLLLVNLATKAKMYLSKIKRSLLKPLYMRQTNRK